VQPRGVVVGDPGSDELAGLIEADEQALVEKLVSIFAPKVCAPLFLTT
jgi:hypothetical protein